MRSVTKVASATLVLALAGTGLAGGARADDAFYFGLCEGMTQPQTVTHPGNAGPVAVADTARVAAGGTVDVMVLANDSDPEHDTLYVTGTSTPTRGEACVEEDGTVEYQAERSRTDYTASFTYGVTDGDVYRSATVTIAVAGLQPVRAVLRHRLGHGGPARLAFTNPNSVAIVAFGVKPRHGGITFRRRIEPGQTAIVSTRLARLQYVVQVAPFEEDNYINAARINTRTGKQQVLPAEFRRR